MPDAVLNVDSRNSLEELVNCPALNARRLSLAPGKVIHESDSPAHAIFYIHSGQIRKYEMSSDGSPRLVEILGQGEWFGSAALAQFASYGDRAVAVEDTVISEIPAEQLMRELGHRPQCMAAVVKELAFKLRAAREDASRLVFEDCNERLLKTLLRFSRSAAAKRMNDEVILHITHQQLAQAVGVARETVSLALTQLRHQNLLRTGRNQLIFNPETLRNFGRRCNTPQAVEKVA